MKQVFDELREQLNESLNEPPYYHTGEDFYTGIVHAQILIDKAEAKWKAETTTEAEIMAVANLEQKLKKYLSKRAELKPLKNEVEDKLLKKAIDFLIWENEHLGKNHDIACKNVHYSYDMEMHEKYLELTVESSWAYSGHDEEYHTIPYEKLLSDDWKEEAEKEYRERVDKTAKQKAMEKEEADRAEYERLKEKFEKEV